MKSVVFSAENAADQKLLLELARKMGIRARVLTDTEQEELGLARAIEEGRQTPVVLKSDVLKLLDEHGA